MCRVNEICCGVGRVNLKFALLRGWFGFVYVRLLLLKKELAERRMAMAVMCMLNN